MPTVRDNWHTDLDRFLCAHCGLQTDSVDQPPSECLNCDDDRECISHQPSEWTTLRESSRRYTNSITRIADGVIGISTAPKFAIGQEVFVLRASVGNIMWDCLGHLDDLTVAELADRGGISLIAISHPHFFGSALSWSSAFGNVPIVLHTDNARWIPRQSPHIQFWSGDRIEVASDVLLIRCGGHFPGSSVLHWREPAGRGTLFTSDTLVPVEDRRWVSFMYSYPNLIPLGPAAVNRIVKSLDGVEFDRLIGGPMYGSGGTRPFIQNDARSIVSRSAERYLRHLDGNG